jgi:hypothetical protein
VRRRIYVSVGRRAVPAALLVAAAFADSSGSAHLAFYAFLALVPVAAVIALNAYGELVDGPADDVTSRRLQALLWVGLLVLAVAGAATRAPALAEGIVPRLGVTVLIAGLIVLCVEGIVEVAVHLRRRPVARRPAAQSGSEEAASLARSISG